MILVDDNNYEPASQPGSWKESKVGGDSEGHLLDPPLAAYFCRSAYLLIEVSVIRFLQKERRQQTTGLEATVSSNGDDNGSGSSVNLTQLIVIADKSIDSHTRIQPKTQTQTHTN